MITLLLGENDFAVMRELDRIKREFAGGSETIDGRELDASRLPDLLTGTTLFAANRLIIIKNLSDNAALWAEFDTWLERVADSTRLVLVEPKPDKRSRTYKQLQKLATVKEYAAWTDRDRAAAEQWVLEEAKRLGAKLDRNLARQLVERTGPDQWRLYRALEKLALLDVVSTDSINHLVDLHPDENVFQLLETALKGNQATLRQMVASLAQTDDPYRVFGLLTSQALQLAALVLGKSSARQVAADIGAAPFMLSRLAPHATALTAADARTLLGIFAAADADLKISAAEPWLLIERALIKTARLAK